MKKLFLFALVATMFAACVTDETQDVAVELAPDTLTVSFEDADSRIQLQNGKTVWTKNDLVSVFYLSDANQQWQYQGETGSRTGNLKRVNAGTSTEKMQRVVVVYPYNENYFINTDTYNVKAFLPASQSYLKDSYGVGGNIMVSQGEYNQFSLKSVCGWLKLQLTGNGEKVKSIKLKGNNSEQVAGEIYINTADATATLAADMGGADDNENTAGGNLVFDDTILTEVVLDCGEGVELDAAVTTFYIALPPQNFEKGLTIEIKDSSDFVLTKSTDKLVTIIRNSIQPMAEFKFVNPNTPAQPTPANNEIWYTATEKVEPYFSDVFGVNIESNVWDASTGMGIITFDGEVSIVGENAFKSCGNLTSITLPECVREIGNSAFSGCSQLASIAIPYSVENIGIKAFYQCSNLAKFTGKYVADNGRCLVKDSTIIAYANASGSEYYSPTSITTIGSYAFAECRALTKLVISDSVTTIADHAFTYCTKLDDLTIGNNVTHINDFAFYGCGSLKSVTIPDSVTLIGKNAFDSCSNLEMLYLGCNVKTIGASAFLQDSRLKAIYCYGTTPASLGLYSLPSRDYKIYVYAECKERYKSAWSSYSSYITSMGNYTGETTTIYYTTTDEQIVTPTGLTLKENVYNEGIGKMVICCVLTEFPEGVFKNCTTLKSITFPDSVIAVNKYAFYRCSSLTSVVMPNVETINMAAFMGCSNLSSVTVGKKLKTVENQVFQGCDNLIEFKGDVASDDARCIVIDGVLKAFAPAGLTEYTIADNVVEIGSTAFANCALLTSVTIPNRVEKIGANAFWYCTSLQSITIPESVKVMSSYIFEDCSSLKDVYCKALTPPAIERSNTYWRAFFDTSLGKIYVPTESVDAYKSANGWSDEYGSRITPYNF